jgi:hypothetical protein
LMFKSWRLKTVNLSVNGNKSKQAILSVTEQIRCWCLLTEQVRCQRFMTEQIRCFLKKPRLREQVGYFDIAPGT